MKYNQLIVGLITVCCGIHAQKFGVVSIKAYQSNLRPSFRFDRLPGDHELRAITTLGNLIRMIYHTTFDYVVRPKDSSWIDHDWWDLDVKNEQPFTESRMIVMLQNVLADRFKLRVEKKQRLETVYVLTVDPGGLKIVKNEEAVRSELSFEAARDGKFVLRATAVTIAQLVFSKPFWELRAPVVDSTGLLDRYDVHWVLGSGESDPFEPVNIIETCKRQLGLKLEMRKGQVDVINIVHVEKPTEN